MDQLPDFDFHKSDELKKLSQEHSNQLAQARYINFINKEDKYNFIINRILAHESSFRILILYFFDKTKFELTSRMHFAGLDCSDYLLDDSIPEGCSSLDVRDLINNPLPDVDLVYVAESHPIYSMNIIPLFAAVGSRIGRVYFFKEKASAVDIAIFGQSVVKKIQAETESHKWDQLLDDFHQGDSVLAGIAMIHEWYQRKTESVITVHVDAHGSLEEWGMANNIKLISIRLRRKNIVKRLMFFVLIIILVFIFFPSFFEDFYNWLNALYSGSFHANGPSRPNF